VNRILKNVMISIILLLTVTAAGTAFFFFHSKGDIKRVPSIFGYKPLTILSNSMKPTFSAGDVVVINVNKKPHENEVVTFKHPQGMLVTHRIIGTAKKNGKTYFLSKGDNNNTSDGIFIPKSSIIGVEEFVIPNLGYISKFLTGPIGFFIFIEVPFLGIVILEIFKRLGIIETKKTTNRKIGQTVKE
jgi:signal peptidase I